jgi:hypothetical protein
MPGYPDARKHRKQVNAAGHVEEDDAEDRALEGFVRHSSSITQMLRASSMAAAMMPAVSEDVAHNCSGSPCQWLADQNRVDQQYGQAK